MQSDTEEAQTTNPIETVVKTMDYETHLESSNGAVDTECPASVSNNSVTGKSSIGRKIKKPGVVYLSSIPDGMTPEGVIKYFSEGIGPVGRISLHEKKGPTKVVKRKFNRKVFCEGWVEFVDKRDAKKCAILWNGTTVTDKKRKKWVGCIWNIKYLPKFQWHHLKERMEFERATHEQRVREETRLAKREAHYYAQQIDYSQADERRAARNPTQKNKQRPFHFTQHKTDEQIQKLKRKGERAQVIENCRANVIANLFKASDTA